jgi:hypothetical protein
MDGMMRRVLAAALLTLLSLVSGLGGGAEVLVAGGCVWRQGAGVSRASSHAFSASVALHLHLVSFVVALDADTPNHSQSVDAKQESRSGFIIYNPMPDLLDGGEEDRIGRRGDVDDLVVA